MTKAKIAKPAPPPPKFARMLTEGVMQKQRWTIRDIGYPLPMRSTYNPEWREVLKECGYPTTVLVLDFETYFDDDYSMKKMSTIEFIMDDRFETLGCSLIHASQPFPDYEQTARWHNGEDGVQEMLRTLKILYGETLEKCTVVAQNAVFDLSVLAFRYNLHPQFCIDTLGLARHWDARRKNDLDTLTKRFGITHKGDTSQFKGWTNRRRFTKPKSRKRGPKLPVQQPVMSASDVQEIAEYANNDTKREWEVFTMLLPRMSCPKTELRVMQHTLELFTKPCLNVDYTRAESLKREMNAEIDREIDALNLHRTDVHNWATREEISGENSFENLLYNALVAAGDDPLNYAKDTKKKGKQWVFATAKDDDAREELETHPDQHVRLLMNARSAIKSWPLHIKRIDRIAAQATANNGVLPVPLKYHGAHTGRWSGGEKINLQNLGSRGHKLVNAVRELLLAPAEHELVIVDSSQIEARGTGWVAGQWDLLEKFESGEEIYCGFAEKVLGYPVRKPRKDGIPAIEARYQWARNSVGKVGVLGCGYGMGPRKAVGYAKGTIDLATAERLVKTYREENPAITQFWTDVERAFTYTYRYGRPCVMPRGIQFRQTDECDVILVLPNGRELKYHSVRMEEGKYGPSLRVYNELLHEWGHIWGGHLTENIVQAISRDILWEAIAKLEADGIHVALHIHDELIIVVPKGRGERVLNKAIKILSERPAWAPELPLAAEGLVTTRYGGH